MKQFPKNPIDNLFKEQLSAPGKPREFIEQEWQVMRTLLEDQKKRRPRLIWMYMAAAGIAALLLLFFSWQEFIPAAIPGTQRVTVLEKSKTPICQSNVIAEIAVIKHAAKSEDQSLKEKHSFLPAQQTITLLRPVRQVTIPADTLTIGKLPIMASSDALVKVDSTVRDLAINLSPASKISISEPGIKGNLRGQRLSLALLGAPDLNGVNNFKGSETGLNISLQIAYHLNNRLSITSGAGYAAKPYRTSFSNYRQANPAWWSNTFNGNMPEQVSADCRVLDIPINLNYTLIHKGGKAFSIGAGLSSYFMLSENYKFNFSNAAELPVDLQITNQNRHFFGVVNLNASYEQRINGSLGLVIQPYAKLPVTQIGFGQVNLKSAGIALGFAWNIHSF